MAECKYKGCNGKAFEDSDYCILHIEFPDNEDIEKLQKIVYYKLKAVQEKVNKGDFNFAGVQLDEVDFSGNEIDHDVDFRNSKINGDVYFDHANISGIIDFRHSEIMGNFDCTELRSLMVHSPKIIHGDVSFELANLEFTLNLGDARILGSVNLYGLNCGEICNLSNTKIYNDLDISSASINLYAPFIDMEVKGKSEFRNTQFKAGAIFNGAKFGDNVDFSEAQFYEYVKFDKTNFNENVNFYLTSFLSTGFFRDINEFNAEFEMARLKNIAFRNCDLSKTRFKHVIFENCELSASKWKDEIPEYYDYKKGELNALVVADTYRRIRQCLQKEGAFNEAGEFYIKEMNMKRASFKKKNKGLWALYSLLLVTSNYGESLKRIIFSFIAIISIFTGIYYLKFNFELSNALSFSAINSIALIYNQPANGLEWVIFAERLIGTFLTAVIIYTFTRKLSR